MTTTLENLFSKMMVKTDEEIIREIIDNDIQSIISIYNDESYFTIYDDRVHIRARYIKTNRNLHNLFYNIFHDEKYFY